jgi:predicted PhzF superfamily epimerase YddE/YHI9
MRRFTQVDVFTDQLTFGNPVAVVHEAEGLTEQEMADFARWTNLSETTFLSHPTDEAADYQVRIFTPNTELPFAGHPTLGTAHAWLEAGGVPKDPEAIVQQCAAGLVRIRRDGTRLAFAAPPVVRGGPVDIDDLEAIMAFLGVNRELVVDAQWVDNGPGWVGLLLTDAETVLALHPAAADPRFDAVGVIGPYLSGGRPPAPAAAPPTAPASGEAAASPARRRHPPGNEVDYEVRAFIAVGSQGEDPVTGSLNASLAQWLIGTGRAPTSYVAAQGTAIGRRGRVYVNQINDDVWIGGGTVTGVTGTVHI